MSRVFDSVLFLSKHLQNESKYCIISYTDIYMRMFLPQNAVLSFVTVRGNDTVKHKAHSVQDECAFLHVYNFYFQPLFLSQSRRLSPHFATYGHSGARPSP